jgi:hypothetical protein
MTPRENYIWREMWTKPQAVVWEQNGLHYEVGLLVRKLTEAEQVGASAGLSTLVRQMMDSLGLTVPGMRANRWKIDAADEAPDRAPISRAGSARGRLRVVPPPSE